MSLHEKLIDLDTAMGELSRNVNVASVMALGLAQACDPYADGFYFISDRLLEAVQSLREQTDRCLQAV